MASPRRTLPTVASYLVHAYTASGLVLAFLAVVAVMEGATARCLWLFLATMVVDGTDGMLARWVQVKRHVPWFDGALLDNIVDYITYAFLPMVLLWSTGALGDGTSAQVLAVVPLLASAYQFCRVDAKTEDHLFLGFPSYWNIAAFYIIVLDLTPTAAAVVLLVCAVLVFVPIGYVYPSRTTTLRATTLVLTCVWLASYAVLLVQAPDPSVAWLAVSVAYMGYYVALSLYLTARRGQQPVAAGG
ncbi:CDP-alcohol phosphatidyltransferase family protein [Microbacterium sp. ARD31]|uniref:CDP-alcohol phosphatidyltransferase family protein n=1 Tax=Microbacterium sp. ARD31 TaxID=2962576 RepID=UPI0028823355|nr:CDP-diacylglycerol O-phosphatidyltransferase [Microbacterium sp. ARD31]MDT0186528.1 CDP-alcohol phosphatidyltransferase family protein [Microbacterium sp. ARD31]